MLLGWWNVTETGWCKDGDKLNPLPNKCDYDKAQIFNMTGLWPQFDMSYLSYTNLAVFTIARVINDILGTDIFDYKSIFSNKELDGFNISSEISDGGNDGGMVDCISKLICNTNELYDVDTISKYVISIIDNNIGVIYNTGIAFKQVTLPDITTYYPVITLMDTYNILYNGHESAFDGMLKMFNITFDDLNKKVRQFTTNYYSAINTVLGEAINYINQKVSEIKNQQEMNSIMPSGPIDLVTRVNPEAAVQQPVQQAVPVQPAQQVMPNPAALSPEEEKAVQMMVNGMFFENMMQNAQQGVPVPQM